QDSETLASMSASFRRPTLFLMIFRSMLIDISFCAFRAVYQKMSDQVATTTTSIICDGRQGPRLRMDVRFCERRNHRREAHMRAVNSGVEVLARSSKTRVRRIALSLDNR